MSDVLVYRLYGEDAESLKQALLTDEVASRANLLFRDAKLLTDREGTYVRVLGTEEQLRRVEELLAGRAVRVEGGELEEVIKKLSEEDERALAGLGGMFGGD
ncbi:MAG: hypothetical protein NZ920_03035 [Aigarchaeota archaeon]|nr:hypothetical protein [Aigarchaeota archaeon]MDW8092402.1 hypothetical protein [Nitrososphaerota archaeon]